MITIPQVVEKIISAQPFLTEALVEGLINISSLARKIQSQVEQSVQKPVKIGAIIMALNRLAPSLEVKINPGLKDVITNVGDIIVRSQLADFTYKNSNTLIEKHTELLKSIGPNQEFFYTMVQGVFESNLVVSKSLKEKVEDTFAGEYLISKSDKLSSVTLKLPSSNSQQLGFYYYILKSIAWAGINIQEVVSTTNEFTLVVNDVDIDKTFSVLKNMGNH
ncbi:aspartate kinase [Ancylomarina longa]|uniref:Aspartate kinase n=1 Tax=Ancylomarina longa TaxID=2487017 RepID=A0A434AZ56_9BACT|nr:aspartate kinase [Ancylomarina longa]RUT79903.1 aspartate kinase [Ancylomarina longa]